MAIILSIIAVIIGTIGFVCSLVAYANTILHVDEKLKILEDTIQIICPHKDFKFYIDNCYFKPFVKICSTCNLEIERLTIEEGNKQLSQQKKKMAKEEIERLIKIQES